MPQSRLLRNVVSGLDGVDDFQVTTYISVAENGTRRVRLMFGEPGNAESNPIPGSAHVTESFVVEELPRRIRAPRRSRQGARSRRRRQTAAV